MHLLKERKYYSLQNSILELFGLVSIIDDYVFRDLKSFKAQFSHNLAEEDYTDLRGHLQPVCKRTLRRQMPEYVKYTKRIAILEEFYPTELEQELYNLVSDYLAKPKLYALPNSQRQLMTLILRKFLASSTYAIYGTFCSLISGLETMISSRPSLSWETVEEDYETDDEWFFDIDGDLFKCQYKCHLSGYREWKDSAEDLHAER